MPGISGSEQVHELFCSQLSRPLRRGSIYSHLRRVSKACFCIQGTLLRRHRHPHTRRHPRPTRLPPPQLPPPQAPHLTAAVEGAAEGAVPREPHPTAAAAAASRTRRRI